jgi:FkbM family methyltransferase
MASSDDRLARPAPARGARLLWHPHQRLWNWELVGRLRELLGWRPAFRAARGAVVAADTLLLAGRAAARRLAAGGGRAPKAAGDVTIYYFDLGTHREAAELDHMLHRVLPRLSRRYHAFGFEASRELLDQARARLAGNGHVTFVHAAVCRVPPATGTIRLYNGPRDGLGNSLYRPEFGEYEEVPALRFSDWLKEQDLDLEHSVSLLRMNIEGAEPDVVADLLDSGLARYVDGFFGMWDDLSKIDPPADVEFRALLARHGIRPFTFNGRDLRVPLRMRSVEYDVRTCVRRGLRRIADR